MTRLIRMMFIASIIALLNSGNALAAKPAQPGWPIPVHDDSLYAKLFVDRLEYAQNEEPAINMDVTLRYGGDYNRVLLKAEGEHALDGEGEMSFDLVFSRMVSSYWDVQAGIAADHVMHDGSQSNTRYSAVAGIMGLAPYWFETDLAFYLSSEGDVSGVLELEYEWLFSQRLVLQARAEGMAAMQAVPEFGVYGGFNSIDTGLRLRYEIRREFAPYVGVEYTRALGNHASALEAAAQQTGELSWLAGFRMWF